MASHVFYVFIRYHSDCKCQVCLCIFVTGISPRISYLYGSSDVMIKESNDPYGVIHMEPEHITVPEIYQDVNLTVKRTGHYFCKTLFPNSDCTALYCA